MALQLFNTLTRGLEPFTPLDPAGKRAGLYCCGPTVYDFAHIGNFRTFVFADLVRRYLEFRGYSVRHVMNITDVEDKIIARVRDQGTTLAAYTAPFEAAFFEDLDRLGCHRPHDIPHATASVDAIVALIQQLETRGLAYRAADGSVYFSIEKYRASGHKYGQLLNLDFDRMRPGERVQHDEYAKESVADFALWKARAPGDGAVFWPSPWGEGRPGWHIECSAMSMQVLGPTLDIHLGGEDLIFPHHEDEIAQSEGAGHQAAGQPFVRYWLHAAHLLVEGKKMSKSLGNYFTLRDLLARGFAGREIRFLLLSAHYRESFNFTLDGLQGARTALARIDECLGKLREIAGGSGTDPQAQVVDDFRRAMDADLNVSAAWGQLFAWVRQLNQQLAAGQVTAAHAAAALAAWDRLDTVLGVGVKAESEAPAPIVALLEARQAARKARDFKRADALRDELKAAGWVIEDTPKGPRLKRA
jgi:cysteinyl-tRNA synthetase